MKILLIESDSACAQELSRALEARGVEARLTGDGKEGVDLARVDRPDLIVLCVELPRMSGYSVCNKLKKDDQLKSIPLVIISAEATPETFEQHRKLKTRAEGYLIKPFEPAALLSTIEGLVPLPPEPALVSSEELVSLDDVEPAASSSAPAQQPSALAIPQQAAAEDDDLKLLDEAFESLASDDARQGEGVAETAAEQAAAPAEIPVQTEPEAQPEIDKLGDEADAALAALDTDETTDVDLGRAAALLDARPGPPPPPPDGGMAGPFPPVLSAPPEIAAKDAEIERLQGRVAELVAEVARATDALELRSGELDEVSARARALEVELGERQTGASRVDEQLRRAAEEHAKAAQAAAERADAAIRAAAEETRRAEERARALEADARAHAQRADREEQARRTADAAATSSADRIRAAEERARAAEARARSAEEHLHAAEERVHSAEQLTHTAEARAVAADARTSAAEARAVTAEQESDGLKLRLEEIEQAFSLKTVEGDQARERGEGLARELDAAQARLEAKEKELGALRSELEGVRGELAQTRTAAEGAQADLERKLADVRKRIVELETQNAKHEERIVKAYQKIKGDEKMREKARKALAIGLQLLEERAAGGASAEVQPRRE